MKNLSVDQTWSEGTYATATVRRTVAAATYKNAWKVKVASSAGGYAIDTFFWYAKGVGLVKIHHEFAAGGYEQVYNQQLISADIT